MLLETYTRLPPDQLDLPEFLRIDQNVTGDPQYSMFNLSKIENTNPKWSELKISSLYVEMLLRFLFCDQMIFESVYVNFMLPKTIDVISSCYFKYKLAFLNVIFAPV